MLEAYRLHPQPAPVHPHREGDHDDEHSIARPGPGLGRPTHPDPEHPPPRLASALAGLNSLAAGTLARTGVPGMVVYRDHVLYPGGFGVREVGRPGRVDPGTVFQLASVSRSIASTIVARLAGEGVGGWDDPVIRHDPGFEPAAACTNDFYGPIEVAARGNGPVLVQEPGKTPFPRRQYDRDVFVSQPTGENAGGPSGVTFRAGPDDRVHSLVPEDLGGAGPGTFARTVGTGCPDGGHS